MAPNWHGVFCALWTPTGPQGELLLEPLRAHLAFLKRSGLHGLLALGSTGEFLHFDVAERIQFFQKLLPMTEGLPVIANVSDLRPRAVLQLAQAAKEAGAHAISVLPPYFYPVAQEDLVEFFARIGEAAQLPVFLYNFPERTGNRISLESIAAVARRVPLAGVKQSGAEFGYHTALAALGREKGFVVLTGSDTQLPEAMQMGAAGCVSGLSNAVPDIVLEVFRNARDAAASSGAAAQRMKEIGALIEQLEFPLNIAAIMEAREFEPGHLKPIVSAATRERQSRLKAALQALFRQWNLTGRI